jgi:hypothetical protein
VNSAPASDRAFIFGKDVPISISITWRATYLHVTDHYREQ